MLIQGGDDQPQTAQAPAAVAGQSPPPAAADDRGKADHKGGSGESKASNHTTLVSGSSFNLVLPAHWAQVDPPTGATFKAVSPGGDVDATLWIKRDPSLTFDQFVDQSRDQLAALSGTKPEVIEQGPAPSTDEAVVKLAADAPAGQPTYQVTLRASGDYRYYLAITTQPDASTEAVIGASLIDGSFTPAGTE